MPEWQEEQASVSLVEREVVMVLEENVAWKVAVDWMNHVVMTTTRHQSTVEFQLDGKSHKSVEGATSDDFHALVLHPLTHRVDATYHFRRADPDAFAFKLRTLPTGSVVLIGISAVTNFTGQLEFALQLLGSKKPLQFAESNAFAMVGVVPEYGDAPKALGEESHPSTAYVKANVPHFFSVAPIANFEAGYVQHVGKQDPFPSEKPAKPELSELRTIEPEFDQFCDLDVRKNLQDVDCQLHPSQCPAEGHPCRHTYEKKVDETNFWELTQRDKDRTYSKGLADLSQEKYKLQIRDIDRTFSDISLAAQIAAGLAAAFAPGSWATPGDQAAKSLATIAERKAEKALALKHRTGRLGNLKALGAVRLHRAGNKFAATRKAAREDPIGALGKGLGFVAGLGPRYKRNLNAPKIREDTQNQPQHLILDSSELSDELPKVLAVPDPKPAPDWGGGNVEQYNLANYLDDSPIQTGLSKVMCDLYCTESAVKESGDAILKSIKSTAETLQSNFEKLMDYQSQLIFFGLGQLKESMPSQAAGLAQEETDLKAGAEDPDVKLRIETELKELPKMLDINIDPSASSIETMKWLKDAGQDLLDSVATILTYSSTSNASGSVGTLASVRSLVESFVARRKLQSAKQEKLSRPQFIQETTSKKLKVVDKYLMQHEHELKTTMAFLLSVKSTEKLFSSPSLGTVAKSLASMRWSSLVAAFTEAHQKHAVFTDSKARALSAAREALRMAEAYIHCKGHSIADLQLQWQRAMRLHDDSGTMLLQAWASTIAAHESLDSAVGQNLFQEMATTAAVGDVSSKQCLGFDSLVQFAHFHAFQAVERALAPVLVQVLALDSIALHQEKELNRMNLEVSTRRKDRALRLDDVVHLLGDIANRSAEPGPDSLQLTARALNIVGSQICPAGGSAKCSKGFTMLEGTHLAAAKPGDLITSVSPGAAMSLLTSCEDTTQAAQAPEKRQGSEKVQRQEKDTGIKLSSKNRMEADEGKQEKGIGEEEKSELITAVTHLESMVEMLLQEKRFSSSTDPEQAKAFSALLNLCDENCSEKFQRKLESQASFLREFAELWIRRPLHM
eukprot:s28_g13.t1